MKWVIASILILLAIYPQCNKEHICLDPDNPVCFDKVPEGELCDAYFERWFYNPESKSCSYTAYSGCSQKGFATKKECLECKNCKDPNKCNHKPPTDELCEAYFEKWFYNKETEKCEQIGYSGCNEWGFDSEEECEMCK